MKNHPTFHLGNDHTDYYEQASYTWSEDSIRFLNTDQFLLIAFVGLITGVGGGILRDLLAGEIPYVLQKHIYATACIFGIIGYYILYHFIPENAAALIGFCLVLAIRYLAKHFEWNLPR